MTSLSNVGDTSFHQQSVFVKKHCDYYLKKFWMSVVEFASCSSKTKGP